MAGQAGAQPAAAQEVDLRDKGRIADAAGVDGRSKLWRGRGDEQQRRTPHQVHELRDRHIWWRDTIGTQHFQGELVHLPGQVRRGEEIPHEVDPAVPCRRKSLLACTQWGMRLEDGVAAPAVALLDHAPRPAVEDVMACPGVPRVELSL
jgi:hypothetical protein